MTFPDVRHHDDELRAGHNFAKDNYNDGDTYGGRALLKIDLNDSWSIMPGVMGQVADFNGLDSYDPQHRRPQADALLQGRLEGHLGPGVAHRPGQDRHLGHGVRGRVPRPRRRHRGPTIPTTPTGTTSAAATARPAYNDAATSSTPRSSSRARTATRCGATSCASARPGTTRLRFIAGGLFAQSPSTASSSAT